MENLPKHAESKEQIEKIKTKIVLEFMRHGKRDKDDPSPDEKVRLNKEGRQISQEKGQILNSQKDVSVAWGSQLERAQETALRAMLPEVDVDASLEDINKLIADKLRVGKKLIIDRRLGYDLSGPSGDETKKAFMEKRYIPYVVEKSDQLAIKMDDRISTTYTRHAGNIAEIIYRYLQIGQNFNHAVSEQKEKYEKYGNQIERYLGTHSGIVEFFLAKVIEKTRGIESRDEFVRLLNNGFKETEGMRVEIVNIGTEQTIKVRFSLGGKDEELSITEELLQDIIREREEYEENFNKVLPK